MNYLRGFLPWIAFAVVSTLDWRWAALVALVLAAGLMMLDRKAGVRLDAQLLDVGSISFFLALTVVAFVFPHSVLQQYDGALSGAWLALIAWGSLAVGRPFTSGIARRQTAPEIWHTPAFHRTNTVITLAWTIAFTAIAIAAFICDAVNAPFVFRAAYEVVGFGVPIWFTRRYVTAVRAVRRAGA